MPCPTIRANCPAVPCGACFICTPTATPTPTWTPIAPGGVVGSGTLGSCTEAALDAALAGGGRVTFNCGPSPVTITVTTTKWIRRDTSLDGGGLITLSGSGAGQVFVLWTGLSLTLNNITIRAGNGGNGGAIYNYAGTLAIGNSTFSGNSARGSGGAIYNLNGATLTITNSTFSGNSAVDHGGAIGSVETTLTITNSTFSKNLVTGDRGGAVMNAGYGTLTITNSTFSGNSAPHCGGAIFNDGGTVTLRNTIAADSPAGGNCCGPITDGGHNLDSGTTCGFRSATGSLSNTNPMLAAGLANNGGPTQTIALLAGSPATGHGDQTICAARPMNDLDQRGFARPGVGSSSCSIGAYEFNTGPARTRPPAPTPRLLHSPHRPQPSVCTETATHGCCDGTPYNRAVQGCCAGTIYNSLVRVCSGGTVVKPTPVPPRAPHRPRPPVCTETDTQGCCDGTPYDKLNLGCCDGTTYDLLTQGCCAGTIYNSLVRSCVNGSIEKLVPSRLPHRPH